MRPQQERSHASLIEKEIEPHRTSHFVITARAGMDAIPAVERRIYQVSVLRMHADSVSTLAAYSIRVSISVVVRIERVVRT
jgi:hypothetical protein